MTDAPTKPVVAHRRPGRPALDRTAPLTRDDIVDRAYDIVTSQGLEALSMRRLAKDLGVTPMAIYHHVPDKPALLSALVERVWRDALRALPQPWPDGVELLVQVNVRIRRAWLEAIELAPFGVAVAPADEDLILSSLMHTQLIEQAGFPDVPLAYSAIQTFTMGSVETSAARRISNGYFGRDPKKVLTAARRLLTKHQASSNHRGVVEARFDEGDDRHFEAGLRALIAGLLAG